MNCKMRVIATIVMAAFIFTQSGIIYASVDINKGNAYKLRQINIGEGPTKTAGAIGAELGGTSLANSAGTTADVIGWNRVKTLSLLLALAMLANVPGCSKTKQQRPAVSSGVASKAVMPQPTSEAMRTIQDVAKKIQGISDGRFTIMFWDTANVNPDENFKELAAFGFNEVITDGYKYAIGEIDDVFMRRLVISAHQAGIKYLKFMIGDPSWPYENRNFAREKTELLCNKLTDLKKQLEAEGNKAAAEIIQGIVMDIEPHVSPSWNFDLGPYCSLHNELEKIATKYGLGYNRVEAFWYSQSTVETGQKLLNYTSSASTTYLMSYRDSGPETFDMADYTGKNNDYIAGFDFATGSPTGYQGNPGILPEALKGYWNLATTERPGTSKGAFIHFGTIGEALEVLDGYRQGDSEQAVTQQKEPASEVEAPALEPGQAVSAPKPGSAKIKVQGHSKSGGTTTFTLKITGLTDEQMASARVLVCKHTDAFYPQPYESSLFNISSDGTVEVQVEQRGILAPVTFYVVGPEFQPQSIFSSESDILDVWAKQGTGIRASLPQPSTGQPTTRGMADFIRGLNADAARFWLRQAAINRAPLVALTPDGFFVRLEPRGGADSMVAKARAILDLVGRNEAGIYGVEEPMTEQTAKDLRTVAVGFMDMARGITVVDFQNQAAPVLREIANLRDEIGKVESRVSLNTVVGGQPRWKARATNSGQLVSLQRRLVENLGKLETIASRVANSAMASTVAAAAGRNILVITDNPLYLNLSNDLGRIIRETVSSNDSVSTEFVGKEVWGLGDAADFIDKLKRADSVIIHISNPDIKSLVLTRLGVYQNLVVTDLTDVPKDKWAGTIQESL